MDNLQDKTILITGASSGIGRACAENFAKLKARLILAARRKDRLEELATRLATDVHLLALDVRDREAVQKTLNTLPEDWKDIDILINNAGLSRDLYKLHEGNIDSWEEMIDTNIKGLLYVSRAVIPGMVKRKKGHIINIGSIAGHEV